MDVRFSLRTRGRRFEIGYERGWHFFVTLPVVGTLQRLAGQGWERYAE